MSGPSPEARPATAIDLWKTAALAVILVDHVGFFLLPEQPWLTAVGRAALPVFFFLIGFARSRHVPWFWWAAGAALTALDIWRLGGLEGATLNIMFNFALIRLLLPLIERHVFEHAWRLALLCVALALLIPFGEPFLEYDTQGLLLALVGLAHRRALESGPDSARDPAWLKRRALGAFATLAFIAGQIDSYAFGVTEAWIMAAGVILASALLLRFRPGEARWRLRGAAREVAAFCGRRSLEIYMAQIVILSTAGMAFGIDAADVDDDDEGDEA